MQRVCATLLGLVLLFMPATVSAQRALQQVLDLNRQAMDAYNNLEIEQAMSLLQQAVQAAERGGVSGAPLARTYVNLGVVSVGGMGDNAGGLEFFVRALSIDGSVQLDPLTSTPDISSVFALARGRAGSGGGTTGGGTTGGGTTGGGTTGGGTTGGGTTGGGTTGGGTTGGGSSGASGSGDLTHVPVPEQLAQTPVPVYIEIEGRPAHVYIYYRGHGMREFQREEMESMGRGFGFEIPCADVFAPEVSYYIVAFATDGSPMGFAGTSSDPVSVAIVSSRTQPAPALPGRAPPDTCGEEECPPGMAGCSAGAGQPGDSCSSNSDCASNNCEDDLCGMSTGGGGGGGDSSTAAPAFFVRVGGGLALSYISGGLAADRDPVSGPGMDRVSGTSYGYDIGLSDTCSLDYNAGDRACVFVEVPGLVVNGGIRLELGYYVHPVVAPRIVARFQPSSGQGPLSFMLIGAGVEVNLTPDVVEGFHAHVYLDGGGGQVQTTLSWPAQEMDADGNLVGSPWAQSGLGFIDVGGTIGYRFMRNVGIVLMPTLIFSIPQFVFTIDLDLGLEVTF